MPHAEAVDQVSSWMNFSHRHGNIPKVMKLLQTQEVEPERREVQTGDFQEEIVNKEASCNKFCVNTESDPGVTCFDSTGDNKVTKNVKNCHG